MNPTGSLTNHPSVIPHDTRSATTATPKMRPDMAFPTGLENECRTVAAKRVLFADEHTIFREGIRHMLQSLPFVEQVHEASDGEEALSLCRSVRPDILITELDLEKRDGLDVIRIVKKRWPETQVIVLTSQRSESRAAAALQAGAKCIVLKRSSIHVLAAALSAMRDDPAFIDPHLSKEQITALQRNLASEGSSKPAPGGLTNRERQVVKLIAEGMKNQSIADHLCISRKTVETHRMKVMQKLGVHNAVDLSRWAVRLGIST